MPALSVIIPTFNRARRLHACLETLSRQTRAAADFEVIVVDDGSTDATPFMLKGLRTPFALRVLWQNRSGQTRARNGGIRAARGEFCLFLDDDMRAGPTLVGAHLDAQRAARVVGIGQITTAPPPHGDWIARNFAAQWNTHFQKLNAGKHKPTWRDCYSGNLSAPRDVLLRVGGLATDLPTWFDLELGYRLHNAGLHMEYLPHACAEHDDSKNGARLLREIQAEGKIAPALHRRHPELLRVLLGKYWETTPRAGALRGALLTRNIPPHRVAQALRFFPRREAYRFLERYAYWYGVHRKLSGQEWQRVTGRTAILMYHAFDANQENASRFVVPVECFAEQLEWLKRNEYNVIRLRDYLCGLEQGQLPPARTVILTFDDGYLDQWTHAVPLLQQGRMPATFFIVSGKVSAVQDWDESELRGRTLMDWHALKTLARHGMEIGAHTRTHPHLTEIANEHALQELDGSRADLEQALGISVQVAAYPYGEQNTAIQALAQASGFIASCTVRRGLNPLAAPPHALHRIEIMGTDSLQDFACKVRTGK